MELPSARRARVSEDSKRNVPKRGVMPGSTRKVTSLLCMEPGFLLGKGPRTLSCGVCCPILCNEKLTHLLVFGPAIWRWPGDAVRYSQRSTPLFTSGPHPLTHWQPWWARKNTQWLWAYSVSHGVEDQNPAVLETNPMYLGELCVTFALGGWCLVSLLDFLLWIEWTYFQKI